MAEHPYDQEWIDRYLRNELNEEQEAEFETALLESEQLQQALESAMGVRQVLLLDETLPAVEAEPAPDAFMAGGLRWQSLAMAASVILAVFSTTMYWRVSNQAAGLEQEIAALRQPSGAVLTVPVDIMRSGGERDPDVVVRKPGGAATVVLDIEASQAVLDLDQVHLALRGEDGELLFAWTTEVAADGRIRSALNAASLPKGRLWLEMGREGEVLDRRLVEFR